MKTVLFVSLVVFSMAAFARDLRGLTLGSKEKTATKPTMAGYCERHPTCARHFCKCAIHKKSLPEPSDQFPGTDQDSEQGSPQDPQRRLLGHLLIRIDFVGGQKYETVLGEFPTAYDCEEATWSYPTCL